MTRFMFGVSLILGIGFLTACTRYEVMVNGFRNMNETITPQATFAIFEPDGLKNDLEFQEYSKMVERKLQERGYRKSDIKSADMAILLNYGIDEGVTKYSASSSPVYGTSNFSGTAMSSSGGTTLYSGQLSGVVGSQIQVDSHTVHKRTLTLQVIDLFKLRVDGSVTPLWKSETISKGSSSDLRRVMPYLIEGTFMHFGENTKMGIRHKIYEGDEAVEKLRNVGF